MTCHIQRLKNKQNIYRKKIKYYNSLTYCNIDYKLYVGINYNKLTHL